MEQCPVCLKIFTSSNYLVSHLHQSACRTALPHTNNHNMMVPTNSTGSTFPGVNTSSTSRPANDLLYHPMPTNAFGDFIVPGDDENSTGHHSFFSDAEDSAGEQSVTAAATAAQVPEDTNCDHLNSSVGASTPDQLTNPTISTIREDESFNVPVGHDDKLIPMLKMIKAVRESGAPLVLLDTLVKTIKQEWQLGRLDITHLCTHKTALRRISKMFPALPTPTSVTVTHERTVDEMNSGWERPSLTFPRFSFIGQLQDLLDDHVFSDLKNLVVDPQNRWGLYQPNSCPHSEEDEIQDGRWFQGIVNKFKIISLLILSQISFLVSKDMLIKLGLTLSNAHQWNRWYLH